MRKLKTVNWGRVLDHSLGALFYAVVCFAVVTPFLMLLAIVSSSIVTIKWPLLVLMGILLEFLWPLRGEE